MSTPTLADWTRGEPGIIYQRCPTCEAIWYFRRDFCPRCGGREPSLRQALGRGTVHASFDLGDDVIDAMRAATAGGAKHLHWFDTDVVDAEGDVVAAVRKQVYVRRKPDRRVESAGA